MATKKLLVPPVYAGILPTSEAIAALKATKPATIPASMPFYRAAWNAGSVLPVSPVSFYRFGPPQRAVVSGKPPYWWLYIADQIPTCIYEAQFCTHNETAPGHFFIEPYAQKNGVIATLTLPQNLKLLDLTGDTAFRMGIYDALSGPAHHWCKWFAYQLVNAGFFQGSSGFHGILYPSRKNRGRNAIALHSGYVNRKSVRANITYTVEDFNKTAEYKELRKSPFFMKIPK